MLKYVDNCCHELKIAFANEIGNLCKSFPIDAHEVMTAFSQDTKLNISPAYLSPGFAFGGSCLPKDCRALTYRAKMHDLELPIVTTILPGNEMHVARGLRLVTEKGQKRIGVVGFSVKSGTDDLRESPVIEGIERLIGKGLTCVSTTGTLGWPAWSVLTAFRTCPGLCSRVSMRYWIMLKRL